MVTYEEMKMTTMIIKENTKERKESPLNGCIEIESYQKIIAESNNQMP